MKNQARALAAALALAGATSVCAHPLGNNTVNRQSTLTITPAAIELRYLLDLAEIPTLIETQQADRDEDGKTSNEEWQAHAQRRAMELRPQLTLALDGRPLALRLRSQSSKLVAGEAGLFTLLLEARYAAQIDAARPAMRLEFRDRHKPDKPGWKEIWLRPEAGAELGSATVPLADRSRGLTDFTLAAGAAPPNELSAAVRVLLPPDARRPGSESPARAVAESDAASSEEAAPSAAGIWGQALGFFRLGMHHIATGWDHLVFLLGLVLLSTALLRLVKIVTAFTIAHSLTLALAATGLVVPPGELVEPAIALTIAYVGLAGLRRKGSDHGVALALFFGLVHGFGFAGAFAQTLSDRMEPIGGHWLINLASFNLGIEVFQVLLVVAFVPLLRLAARAAWSAPAHRTASAAVLIAGLAWFVGRTLPPIA
jgi:hypothetical protein